MQKPRKEGGTLNPYFIEMCPAARLIKSFGTKSGETFFAPFSQVRIMGQEGEGGDSHL